MAATRNQAGQDPGPQLIHPDISAQACLEACQRQVVTSRGSWESSQLCRSAEMTYVWTKEGLLEDAFGVGSWPRHPRGRRER